MFGGKCLHACQSVSLSEKLAQAYSMQCYSHHLHCLPSAVEKGEDFQRFCHHVYDNLINDTSQ